MYPEQNNTPQFGGSYNYTQSYAPQSPKSFWRRRSTLFVAGLVVAMLAVAVLAVITTGSRSTDPATFAGRVITGDTATYTELSKDLQTGTSAQQWAVQLKNITDKGPFSTPTLTAQITEDKGTAYTYETASPNARLILEVSIDASGSVSYFYASLY